MPLYSELQYNCYTYDLKVQLYSMLVPPMSHVV